MRLVAAESAAQREALGPTVPVPIPTTDGRLLAHGVVVMTYVEGGPPETGADWRRVATRSASSIG
jgi:hypothetical protein